MDYIKIVLKSDLCASSGESMGNAIDSEICVDSYGFPYLPARRIKGCLRHAADLLTDMGMPIEKEVQELFGDAFGKEGEFSLMDAQLVGATAMQDVLKDLKNQNDKHPLKKLAQPRNITGLFSTVRGQTALEEGIKVDNSLRFIRVLNHYNPLNVAKDEEIVFIAPIYLDTTANKKEIFKDICQATKHMGLNRNRGLGNVSLTYCEDKKEENSTEYHVTKPDTLSERVKVSYQISLDSPVTLPGCDSMETAIPARSVIGCMAAGYLRLGKDEKNQAFQDLFLNGTANWSSLTPVIEGKASAPIPMFLMKLKNRNGEVINTYAQKDSNWKAAKPKTMEGTYAVTQEDGFSFATPGTHILYHNSRQKQELYMQTSLDQGMVYGGNVEIPSAYLEQVLELLEKANWRFGRSKTAQYSICTLLKDIVVSNVEEDIIDTTEGENIYVVLKSNLVLQNEGKYEVDSKTVRKILADTLGLKDKKEYAIDYCRYGTVGGFQTMWHLQKPHVPVVLAGSVYCFLAKGDPVPSSIRIGDFLHEGFGECSVFTQTQMDQLQKISQEKIAQKSVEDDPQKKKQMLDAMMIKACKEAILMYARNTDWKVESLPKGRLRLMLSEADDLESLVTKVNSIKESDVNSKKEISAKQACLDLIDQMYGSRKTEDYSKLLCKEEGLWELVKGNSEVMQQLQKLWKLPMESLLHELHYR